MKVRLFLLLTVLLISTDIAHAQSFAAPGQTGVSLEVSPSFPQPGADVTVVLNDFSSSNYGGDIQWFVNDVPVPDSANRRNISIKAGEVNSRSVIKAILTSKSGTTETVTSTIAPIYLDLIVEPQTHVPDFFLGRPLASTDSGVNLTALLNNGTSMGRDFIYTWTINNKVFEGGSMRGRNSINFNTSIDTLNKISLEVASLSGEVITRRTVLVPTVLPKIVFYEENPLYGLSMKALTRNFIMTGNSATIRAIPYYLDSRAYNAPDVLEWEIDNSRTGSDTANPYSITLERTGELGNATLNFRVYSSIGFLQTAQERINIQL